MIGLAKVEKKQTSTGKDVFKITIDGKVGSSFDKKFEPMDGKVVEVTEEKNGEYLNYKFIREVVEQKEYPVDKTIPAKIHFIVPALQCAINTANLVIPSGTKVNSVEITKVAETYLNWFLKQAE